MSLLPLRTLASVFFRIGNTTFGGGDPTIAALQRELVARRGVLSDAEYGALYALARITPGTNMLAFCAGAGWLLRGWFGALIAVAAVTAPSAVLAVLILRAFEGLMRDPVANAAISAMIAGAVGLMFAGAWLIVRPSVDRRNAVRTLAVVTLAFVLVWFSVLSAVQVLALAAVAGFFWKDAGAR